MELPNRTRRPSHRNRTLSGQILAEACIGMALLVFVWMLVSFIAYMANNRIRTAMAVRDAAWLQSKGISTESVPGAFFYGDDIHLVHVTPQQETLSLPIPDLTFYSTHDNDACNATVKFGMTASDLKNTAQFPFTLMNTHVPFMPDSLVDNFLSVTSNCAWPDEVDTDTTWIKALDVTKSPLGIATLLKIAADASDRPLAAAAVALYLATH